MADRLTQLAEEFKAAGRHADATAALAGALAIYLDQFRGGTGQWADPRVRKSAEA